MTKNIFWKLSLLRIMVLDFFHIISNDINIIASDQRKVFWAFFVTGNWVGALIIAQQVFNLMALPLTFHILSITELWVNKKVRRKTSYISCFGAMLVCPLNYIQQKNINMWVWILLINKHLENFWWHCNSGAQSTKKI